MYHLDDTRLMELALDSEASATKTESSHLMTCPKCVRQLSEERTLTAAIEEIPLCSVPSGFAQMVVAQFVKATETKVKVKIGPSLVLGIVVATILTSLMLWTIIANPSIFVSQMALAVGKAAAFSRAIVVVLSRVPLATEIVTTSTGAIVLVSAGLLGGLLKRAELVK